MMNFKCHKSYSYLLFVFVAALLVRVVFVLTLQNGFYFPDTIEYSGAAVNLLTHGELGAAYHRPPAYAAFLAAIYAFFGENIFAVRMIESVIGAILAVIVAMIGRRIGGDAVGMMAGGLWSIYPLAVFTAALMYPTGLMAILLACGILYLLPPLGEDLSQKRVFLAGVLLGLAALAIPIVLLTTGAISLWIMLWARRNRLLLASLVIIGAAIIVVPWTVRDFHVYGRVVPVEPRVIAHLPEMPDARNDASNNRIAGILKHPSLFAAHYVAEFLHFWKLYPDRIMMANPTYREQVHQRDRRVVKQTIFTTSNLIRGVSVLSTGPVFLFAIVGTVAMWFQRDRRPHLWLLLMIIMSVPIGYSGFYTAMRFRIPIEPYIIILGAYGLRQSWLMLASYFAVPPRRINSSVTSRQTAK